MGGRGSIGDVVLLAFLLVVFLEELFEKVGGRPVCRAASAVEVGVCILHLVGGQNERM